MVALACMSLTLDMQGSTVDFITDMASVAAGRELKAFAVHGRAQSHLTSFVSLSNDTNGALVRLAARFLLRGHRTSV